jgi:hypothetical protein
MAIYSEEILDLISTKELFKMGKKGICLGDHDSKVKRELIVKKIMELPGGSKEKPQNHLIYKSPTSNFEIFAAKPGKEASRKKNPNIYDLHIYIKENNKEMPELGKSFKDIFKSLEDIKEHEKALDLMAYILIRNAFCYDHNNSYDYLPSNILIEEIKKDLDQIHGLPVDVFLHFLDLIASNEDVKYSNKGNSLGQGTGRRNNLLTYVNVIALLQGKIKMWELIGALSSGAAGVAQISTKSLYKNFPLIDKNT